MKKLNTLLLGSLLGLSLTVQAAPAASTVPEITVYKSATCGCCKKWISHLEANGFKVVPQDMKDLRMVKTMSGVKPQYASCHTGVVNGYVMEGHVPAADVKRFLAEKPDAVGLSVPGMPVGTPGMEQGDRRDNYRVLMLKKDGTTETYAQHGPAFD